MDLSSPNPTRPPEAVLQDVYRRAARRHRIRRVTLLTGTAVAMVVVLVATALDRGSPHPLRVIEVPPVSSAPVTQPFSTIPPRGGTRLTVPSPPGPTPTTLPPKVTGFLAQSVSFVSANDGYVIGIEPCPTGICLAMRHTTNRGLTWTKLPPPPATLDRSGSGIPGLHFADPLNWWALGSAVWATHDGGRDWHTVAIGGQVVAMASGAGVVFALVETCESSSSCPEVGHLYRSPVGQDAWAPVAGVSGQSDGGGFSLVVAGRSVFVLDGDQILASSDGMHFASLSVPCAPPTAIQGAPFFANSVAASDPSDVAVACVGEPSMNTQFKQAFVSRDGGRTYQRLPDPPWGGLGAEVVMPSPTTILLTSMSFGGSLVYRDASVNGTWATPVSFHNEDAGLSNLAFVDPAHGAVVAGPAGYALFFLSYPNPPPDLGTIYLTDDGGTEWHLVRVQA